MGLVPGRGHGSGVEPCLAGAGRCGASEAIETVAGDVSDPSLLVFVDEQCWARDVSECGNKSRRHQVPIEAKKRYK